MINRVLELVGCVILSLITVVIGMAIVVVFALSYSFGCYYPTDFQRFVLCDMPVYAFGFLVTLLAAYFLYKGFNGFSKSKMPEWNMYLFILLMGINIFTFVANLLNHFYAPAFYRAGFYIGLFCISIFILKRFKILLVIGALGIALSAYGLFVAERQYRCKFYSACESLGNGNYICDGRKIGAGSLERMCESNFFRKRN